MKSKTSMISKTDSINNSICSNKDLTINKKNNKLNNLL